MSAKQCRVCEELKPLDDFYKMAGMRDGHRNECKECLRAQHRDWYRRNRDHSIAYAKAWQQENAERLDAYRREYNARPERKRKCPGAIRGILCLSCNQALGHFRDDPAVLQRAVDYVRSGRAT